MVYASESAKDGRYFHKTLLDLDQATLVRDRNGHPTSSYGSGDDEEDEEDQNVDEDDEPVSALNKKAKGSKTQRQTDLENEWGLSGQPQGFEPENSISADDLEAEKVMINQASLMIVFRRQLGI